MSFAVNGSEWPIGAVAATQQFSRFWSEADIQGAAITEPDL
jgi:hypothetical protein